MFRVVVMVVLAAAPAPRVPPPGNSGAHRERWRADGVKVLDNWTDLTDAGLAAPINVTYNGRSVDAFVWTATWPNGTLDDGGLCGAS